MTLNWCINISWTTPNIISVHHLCWRAADICQIKSMAWYLHWLPWMIAMRHCCAHASSKKFSVNSLSSCSVAPSPSALPYDFLFAFCVRWTACQCCSYNALFDVTCCNTMAFWKKDQYISTNKSFAQLKPGIVVQKNWRCHINRDFCEV